MVKVFNTGSRPRREAVTAENNLNARLSRKYAARLRLIGATIVIFASLPAAAKDPGREAYMMRVLTCEGSDAKMEIYLPQSAVFDRNGGTRTINKSIIGYYALDLSEANKGKPLEPVRISLSPDKKTLIVEQYTRGLPPTRIPVAGGTVDFDNRFGTGAKCGPLEP
jgi:hypothetical protein